MPATDKITNNLFVWGSSSVSDSDLAVVTPDTNGIVEGSKGGELVYADYLNSGIRTGSLVTYALIQALIKGPVSEVDPTKLNYDGTNWWDDLTSINFDYKTLDNSIDSFATNLQSVINQYLKYSRAYSAIKANKWNISRTFTITSNDGTNPQATSGIDGSADVVLKLPSTIKASLDGTAKNVNTQIAGIPLENIFDTSGDQILSKVLASKASDQILLQLRNSTNSYHYLTFVANTTDNAQKNLYQAEDLKYNPSTKILSVIGINSPVQYGNWGTCSSASSTVAKTVSITGFALQSGAHIFVKMNNANTANSPTLNVTSTGAKSIRCNGIAPVSADSSTLWGSNEIVEFIYDGTYWQIVKSTNVKNSNTASNATTADTASNLANKPVLNSSGNYISVTAGGKTSETILVPYSVNSGTATQASKLTTENIGGVNKPVYFSNGIPVQTNIDISCGSVAEITGALSISADNIREGSYTSLSSIKVYGCAYRMSAKVLVMSIHIGDLSSVIISSDKWLRLDLRISASSLGFTATDSIGSTNYTTANIIQNATSSYNLAAAPTKFITYHSGRYLYIGLDERGNAAIGGLDIQIIAGSYN